MNSLKTAVIAGVVAALVAGAMVAVASVVPFNLSTTANTVTAATGASGSIGGNLFTFTDNSTTAGAPLALTNNSTAAGATALKLAVTGGNPPFTVNHTTKVPNLNADLIDGVDSTGFLRTTGKAADSNLLDGIDSTGFLRTTAKAADSDKLDGLDSTAFLRTSAKAADSNLLDGIDSTGFVQGRGKTYSLADAPSIGNDSALLSVPSFFDLKLHCHVGSGQVNVFSFVNRSDAIENLFIDDRDTLTNTSYRALNPGEDSGWLGADAGDHSTVLVQGTPGGVQTVATVEVASAFRAAQSNCHVQMQAVVTNP